MAGCPPIGFSHLQAVVSLSSSEYEFYGASTAAIEGRGVVNLLRWIGLDPDYILGTDSSTAKTIVNREGAGRLKHLDQRALWLQSGRRDHGL